ncbi:MAG TPA: hypothetical protein PKB06_03935 [Actinotalea sp.]|nr:hypothetical protein [Actinotalea sp.]
MSTSARAASAATLLVLVLAACGPAEQPAETGPSTVPLSPAPTTPAGPEFPGPETTGVPAGIVLEPSSSLVIDEDGTVVDGLDVDGCVVIAADDVTIRNTRITCTDSPRHRAVSTDGSRTGLVIEDTEVDGGGVTDIGIDVSNVVIRRVDVHNVNDGIRMGSNITVEDSWVHDLVRADDLHPDAIQGISSKNIIIRGNTLDPRNPDTGDLANSAIQLGSETGDERSENVVIEGNYLNGGNYSLNLRLDITAEDFVIRDNVFGPDARYGPMIGPPSVRFGTGNVLEDGSSASPTYREGE